MKKLLTAVLSILMAISCINIALAQTADSKEGLLFSFSYQDKNNGVVDHKTSAIIDKVTEDGKKALKVVPNTEDTETKLALDCYSLRYPAKDIEHARYMTIEYKYVCPEQYANVGAMHVILSPGGKALKKSIPVNAQQNTKAGEWSVAVFDVSEIADNLDLTEGNIFKQFHLYPFGKSANPQTMSKDQVMYIADVSFYSINPDTSAQYTVTFRKGNPNASGKDPAEITVKRGQQYTLPAQTYAYEGGEFLGWRYSVDKQLYKPGDTISAADANATFSAEFSGAVAVSEYRVLNFADYHGGSVDKRDNLLVSVEEFQGKEVVKVVPNPESSFSDKNLVVDGYTYNKAGIDIAEYKYIVFTYYYDGDLKKEYKLRANVLPGGGILTKIFSSYSEANASSGRWDIAVFCLDGIEEFLTPDMEVHTLKQIHFYPFFDLKSPDFRGDEAFYINSVMFFKDKPDLEIHESYMKGYEGGFFKPQGNMTRAEACTIVARLSAGADDKVPTDKTTVFADVPADQWYYKYVSYVESLGYLKSYSGSFEPNKAITRAEFVELVYNMGLLRDAGKNGTFTDVSADHPKAEVVSAAGKAGLVNGYDNGDGTFSFKPDATITRAEVVKVINNAYKRGITRDDLTEDMKYSFEDVELDFWAYADIMEAVVPHVENSEGWVFTMVTPLSIFGKTNDSLDFAAGEAIVKEIDEISEKRRAEIRATATSVEVKGTKYYISNNGDDKNDGKSPEKAWKTIEKLEKSKGLLKSGDGVFFERGGLWRGQFGSVAGVTYSAYGEGEKPKLYGSPENGADPKKWSLLAGTANIWVYETELVDVGGIICDGGETVGLKVLADLFDGKFYVRGSRKAQEFDLITELNENYEFFSDIPSTTEFATKTGKLYFKCDEGNPGEIFDQIEFNINGNLIRNNGDGCTYDNLCIMYTGKHGIGSSHAKHMTVTNCEFGWIGGTIHNYTDGKSTRLGNGVEIYGEAQNYTIDNCYVYQCYDAGITHQYRADKENISMYDITYTNNLIEDCIYSIEYFLKEAPDTKLTRDGKNFLIKDNILRRAGYGWGNQRPDSNVSAHIKSWVMRNEYEKGTYIIENNIFDRANWKLLQTVAGHDAWAPIYKGNTYVQVVDGGLAEYKQYNLVYDCYAEATIKGDLGDTQAKVYFLPESYKHQGFSTRG
ncbi:MAG: S-layer homology domain-containing protein [Clostridia bacterium]|nr:S-layer homology domain-containing protein [Clostridia bacterium]